MGARVGIPLGSCAVALCVLVGCSGVGDPIVAGADASLLLDASDLEVRDAAVPAKPIAMPPPADTYCDEVEDKEWPDRWQADEDRLADLLNALRARPTNADCGAGFSPAPRLARDSALNCIARKRAGDFVAQRDMNDRGLPDVNVHLGRGVAMGFVAEISVNASTPEEARARWTDSDEAAQTVCRILLERSCTLVGVGRWEKTWTIEIGGACRPPSPAF